MPKIKSWEISDEFWAKIEPLVPVPIRAMDRAYKRKAGGGRKPMAAKLVFAAIIYVLRTGCHWNAIPEKFGSSSSIHKYFQQWHRAGFFLALWRAGLAEYDDMQGIAWEWQSIDGCMTKAPWLLSVSVATRPTGGKKGRKRSLLVDGRGVPLSIVASGANTHDVNLLKPTLAAVVVKRPAKDNIKEKLNADAGYKGKKALKTITAEGYVPNVKQRREEVLEKEKEPGKKARRWVVEVSHSWFNRFRKLLVSFEKKEESYVALLTLAAAQITWRQTIFIYG